jgi:glucokinase
LKQNVIFGMDIGGTNIKSGIIDAEGNILHTDTVPTEAQTGGRDSRLSKLFDIAERQSAVAKERGWTPIALGVGTAGYVNAREGRIGYATSNLPGWTGVPLRAEMERHTGLPVALANDAHAFAMGEAWIGAGREWDEFICITLGTGVGGCLVVNGRPYYGRDGYGGGFGHMVLQHGGAACNCGLTGCWEQYASVTGLMRMAEEQGIDLATIGHSAKTLFEQAKQGQERAAAVIELYAEYVALGLTNLVHALNPQAIVIGGAVTAQGDFLLDQIRANISRQVMPAYDNMKIVAATLGEHAGFAGAARLALQRAQEGATL